MSRKVTKNIATVETAKVTVIVPVYNGFIEALDCLESVVKNTSPNNRILIIDDASPEGNFESILPIAIKTLPHFKLLRNEKNLGFVGTCNRGMTEAGTDDVVLLNSDTVVTPNWLEKMKRAAYSSTRVGTVTPLTNNGTICSIPNFCQDNELPLSMTPDQVSELVERVSARAYSALPTCVGFCVYIKRELLDRVGLLDEEHFGKGYGEENDLSCRAQNAGFIDIIDDATFVYHKGSVSFKGEKAELSRRNSEVLARLHPNYFRGVHRFISTNPLAPIQDRVNSEILKLWDTDLKGNAHGRRILHIVHNGPYEPRHHNLGGTELHVQDLIRSTPQFRHWSLVSTRFHYILTAHVGAMHKSFWYPKSRESLQQILAPNVFAMLHVHQLIGYDFADIIAMVRAHGRYFVSLHDYNFVCRRINLFTREGKVCTGFGCVSSCEEDKPGLNARRALSTDFLNEAAGVIDFSDSTRQIFASILGERFKPRLQRIPHGLPEVLHVQPRTTKPSAIPRELKPLKVLFLGSIAPTKGLKYLLELSSLKTLPSGSPVEWHLLGLMSGATPALVHAHGYYERGDVVKKIHAIDPDLVLIPSACPETYCLTLDEAWVAGVPALVTPIGAPPERVKKYGGGWVLNALSTASILESLEAIVQNAAKYNSTRAAVEQIPLPSTTAMGEKYSILYENAVTSSAKLFADKAGSAARTNSLETLLNAAKVVRPLPRWIAPARRRIYRVIDWAAGFSSARLAFRTLKKLRPR